MARRGGFTLIEMMVAMAIATFGLLVILGLFAATVLMAQQTEVDLVTEVAYQNAVHAVETTGSHPGTGFSPALLGNLNTIPPTSVAIGPGEEFAWADESNGLIKGNSGDYAVTVNFGATAVSQWFTVRRAFDGASPPPPEALPGEVGLQYVTIHTGHIDQLGAYSGSPHAGEVLNEVVLIGVAPDEMDN